MQKLLFDRKVNGNSRFLLIKGYPNRLILIALIFFSASRGYARPIDQSVNYDNQTALNLGAPDNPPGYSAPQGNTITYEVTEIPLGIKYIEDLKSLDVDSDGRDELVVLTNYDGSTQIGQLNVYKWNNDEFELFWQSSEIPGYPYGMQVVDLDEDGRRDVLAAWNGLLFFRNNDSCFINENSIITETPDDILVCEDLNDDGLLDLANGGPGFNSGYVHLWRQDSTSRNFDYLGELQGTAGSNMVKRIDINGNGNPSILNGELYSGDVYVYRNDKNFSFAEIFSYQFNTRIFSIESADFDNDNFEDFIIAEAWANIHFFENNAQESFNISFEGANIGSCFSTLAYDLDGDSQIDLVAAAFDGRVYLYHNLGGFNFDQILCEVNAPGGNYGLTIGNFNGDKLPDMAFGEDPVIVVFDALGSFGLTAIHGSNYNIPADVSLSQNYPNPFNASTAINYDLPKACDVTIEIFDILGRKIESLNQGKQQPGQHSVVWKADGFSSGMYFYRIQAGEFTDTKKMLLLK